MRVNKYTATLITFFLSAVVHELGKHTLIFVPSTFPSQNLPYLVTYGSDLVISHVGAVQEAAWLPAFLTNVANTPGSIEQDEMVEGQSSFG
jgi:hypothetical protein